MGTKTMLTVEDYLHTVFDGADCEYVEGEIIERNRGQTRHGKIQLWLGFLLAGLANRIGIQAGAEVRIKIADRRYRIPDLSVWRRHVDLGDGIPHVVPFLAIEILSPDDRPMEMLQKIREYLAAGIEWIWVIDPYDGRAMVYSHRNPAGETAAVLRTEDPSIELALEAVLNPEI